MKEKVYTIDLPVFNYIILVIITDDLSNSIKKRESSFGRITKEIPSSVDALHICCEADPNSYIFISPHAFTGVVAHEVFHAIWRMFEYIGAKNEEETFAYHLSYIIDKIQYYMSKSIK